LDLEHLNSDQNVKAGPEVVTINVEENDAMVSSYSTIPEPVDAEKQSSRDTKTATMANPKKFASTYDTKKATLIFNKSKQYDLLDVVSVYCLLLICWLFDRTGKLMPSNSEQSKTSSICA
jgi:hypothetical protein